MRSRALYGRYDFGRNMILEAFGSYSHPDHADDAYRGRRSDVFHDARSRLPPRQSGRIYLGKTFHLDLGSEAKIGAD